MLETVACVLLVIIGSACVIFTMKCALDDEIPPDYRYCEGCKNGFCMAEPKGEDCVKWEKEKDT